MHVVEAYVHKEINNGFRLKVSLLDLGMHMNGFRVYPVDENRDWYVIPPQMPNGPGKYIDIVEFNKSQPLWIEISKKCVEAVKDYLGSDNDISDEDLTDEALARSLDEALK